MSQSASNEKTILIVDDIPLMRTMLSRYVKTITSKVLKEEYDIPSVDICEAENGLIALETVRSRPVDLIFLDLMMPEMDGLTFLEEMRKSPEYQEIPVVVCSALGEKETIARAINLGAKAYIIKPFTMKSVEKTVRDTLGKTLAAARTGG
ncbi:MAG: response regulator [Planctomycetes bacterium]|nr:response regulator [Planctomycetota bacterium]